MSGVTSTCGTEEGRSQVRGVDRSEMRPSRGSVSARAWSGPLSRWSAPCWLYREPAGQRAGVARSAAAQTDSSGTSSISGMTEIAAAAISRTSTA